MKILAIDPGNVQSAYVVMDSETFEIGDRGIEANQALLNRIYHLTYYLHVNTTVIEMIQSFGMPVGREVFETVFWIGRFYQESKTACHRIYRNDIKLHLCRSARAKDGNIRQAILDRLGPQGVKKKPGPTYGISKDLWSAVAVGLTWIDQNCGKAASDFPEAS